MKKKIISLILAATMVLSPTTAFAEDTTNNIIYTEGKTAESFEQNVAISASKGGEFVVAVPKVGNLEDGADMSLKVGIYADIASDKKVVIAPVDSTPDETPDVCNFTIKNIVPVGFVGRDDIHGEITTIKTDFPYNDTAICTNRDDITNPENMVEILTYRADYPAGEWAGTITLNISLQDYVGEPPVDVPPAEAAGLYNADGVMLCSWEASGIDVKTDYTSSTYKTATTSPYYVLTNNYTAATKVILPDTLTSIGNYAFYGCNSLESIDVQEGITTIGCFAFANCSELQEMLLPESLTSLGQGSFKNDSNLTHITIHKNVTDATYNQTSGSPLDNTFYGCTNLTSAGGIGSGCSIEFDMTSIPSSMFAYTNLTSITIPNSVTSIGDYAFENCNSLTSIIIPSSVTKIGINVFNGTPWLTEKRTQNPMVIVNGILIDGKTTSGEVTIPDSVTCIAGGAFKECSSLTSITIPNSVTSIGKTTFFNCTGLTSITIPNSVMSIGASAFTNCTSLTSVTFENTSNWYVGSSAGSKDTDISSSDLADTSTAATYLKTTYSAKYWMHSAE